MKTEDVKSAAAAVKPADICEWTAEQLAVLPKEAKTPAYTGRWSKNMIQKWLVERFANTNNPGSIKMSCCNMLRAAIKRADKEVANGSIDKA